MNSVENGATEGPFGFGGRELTDPTPVRIYMKNGAYFNERGSQAIDTTFPEEDG